jgi:methyl-accepting chemotaxis protein
MFFNNLKLGVRLSVGYAGLILLTLVVGLFSINRLGVVNEATAQLATQVLPATRDLGTVRAELNAVRRAEAMLSVATSQEIIDREVKSLTTAKGAAGEAWKSFQTATTTDDGRALVAAIGPRLDAYRAALAHTLELAKKGDIASASVAYQGDSRTAFSALMEAVDKCVDYQTKQADAAYKASQDTYQLTRNLIAFVMGAVVLVGIWLGRRVTLAITTPIAEALRLARTVSSGDLTAKVNIERRDEIGQLLTAMAEMNGSLSQIVGDVRKATDSIATGSGEIAAGNADLSQRTEQQASNLQQTAASMEQLTVTVKNNADSAQQARQLSEVAQDAALKGGRVVGNVVATMGQISESSKKISDIISVIDGIAFQTNILALNAAVEAARAGESGRGFAVVAAEVRSLSQRTASAAKEIKSLIGTSVERVEQGSAQVDEAGCAIEEIVTQVKRVHDLVGEISAASLEQTAGLGQINDAVLQLDKVTQQNAALVEESAAAAESLRHQAEGMAQTVAKFRLDGESASVARAAPAPVASPARPVAMHATAHALAAAPRRSVTAEPKVTPIAPSPTRDDEWETF